MGEIRWKPGDTIALDQASFDAVMALEKVRQEALDVAGVRVVASPYLPKGTMAVLPLPVWFERTELVLDPLDSDAYNVRLTARFMLPPPPPYLVLTNLDGSAWPEFVNTRPRTRKNPARTTWGHQLA